MRWTSPRLAAWWTAALFSLAAAADYAAAIHAQAAAPFRLAATIPLPNVSGRIDHLAFDASRQHLFVAALGNNTVEVLDVAKNQHLQSLRGFHEPQGLAVLPDMNAVAIANGDSGTLQLIDAQSLQTRWTISIGGDADNVRYDSAGKRVYVAAEGGLYAVDPATGKVVGRITIDGHPESFQLESAGAAVYANLPGVLSAQVIAADRRAMTVSARWSPGCSGNYPMALDAASSRVLIGCRRPARVAILDTRTGKSVGSVDTVGDTDDMFYDDSRQRVYVIGGEGFVDVLRRRGDTLQRLGRTSTRAGARTGLWVAALNRLFVAVPSRTGQSAEIRVFEAS